MALWNIPRRRIFFSIGGVDCQEWRVCATADRRLVLDSLPRLCYLRQGGGDIPLSRLAHDWAAGVG